MYKTKSFCTGNLRLMHEMQLLISGPKLKSENDKIDIYKFTMAAIEVFVQKVFEMNLNSSYIRVGYLKKYSHQLVNFLS